MKRNYKNQNKRNIFLVQKTLDYIKGIKNNEYKNEKLNKTSSKKIINKTLKRNSSLKISDYNHKKLIQTYKHDERNNNNKSKFYININFKISFGQIYI